MDAAYYGYSPDEDDDALLAYEAATERESFENLLHKGAGVKAPPAWEPLPGDSGDGRAWELPTMAEVQQELVDRRKRRLLDRF